MELGLTHLLSKFQLELAVGRGLVLLAHEWHHHCRVADALGHPTRVGAQICTQREKQGKLHHFSSRELLVRSHES